MKRLTILLFILVLTFGCSTIHYTKKLTEISEKVTPSVVLIIMYDSKGNSVSQGTGFFISENGDIITNYHVIVGTDTGVIKTTDENIYSIKGVVAKDTLNDLVRLSVDIPPKRVFPLPLDFNYPKVGEKIAVIGNPFGLEHTLTVGYVSAIQEFQDYGKFIQFDASISSGSSGSPLINMNGKAIGIVTSTIKEGENLNFAIPIEYIFRLTSVKKEPIAVQKKTIEEDKWYSIFPKLYIPCLSMVDKEDYENALACFDKILHQRPNDGLAYIGLAMCYDGLGDSVNFQYALSNAMTHLENNVKENPNDSLSHFILATCYENDEAIKTCKKIISLHPTWYRPYEYLGYLYKELKQYTDALIFYKEATRLNPRNEDLADVFFSLGEIFLSQGEYKEACEAFIQVTKINSGHSGAYKNLGEIYEQIGLYDDAIQSYQNAIDSDPGDIRAYFSIAYVYRDKMHDNGNAFDYYVKILEIEPNNRSAILYILNIYEEAKMYREASEYLKKLIKQNPDDWELHLWLALNYSSWAMDCRDIKKETREISMYGRITLPQDAIELFEKSILHYEQMIRISPPNDAGIYFNIGQKYKILERYSKAIHYYKKSIEIDSTNSSTYERLANSYRELGKYNEAIENYKLAIKYNTEGEFLEKVMLYCDIGCIYLKIGDKKNARKQYKILKSMNSEWAEYLLEKINEYK